MDTTRPPDMADLLAQTYCAMERSENARVFSERHGIRSAPVLTVTTDEVAGLITERVAPRIRGKTIVEIGGGLGLLALHMSSVAERVFCIEANPIWSHVFVDMFVRTKPKNMSFLFGAADEFVGHIRGDISLFCTHSDVVGMTRTAGLFAPIVIDVYGEIIEANPAAFDAFARRARSST